MRGKSFIAVALLCLAAQRALAEDNAGRKSLQSSDPIQAVVDFFHPPVATPPPAGTLPPASTSFNYLQVNVDLTQAEDNQPTVVQQGSTPLFPGMPTAPFELGTDAVHFLVIGDWGRTGATASVGLPQCSTKSFGKDNNVQGGLQQEQSALLADQVCGQIGGCSYVLGMGDNFYECGIYPGDTEHRFTTDWNNIYNAAYTPHLNGLTWYSTFGNHDMVIAGSVEAQINYTTINPQWQLPSNYYYVDLPQKLGQPSIRAFFIDANPFIAAYNVSGNKYNQEYFQAHLNQTYIDDQIAWLDKYLKLSTAAYNIVVAHYPLFGTGTQYGFDQTAAPSPYPGNYNGWELLLETIYANNVAVYFNGHDHVMTAGNPAQPGAPQQWNQYTSFLTSGAGSWGETTDSCGPSDSYLYTDGGAGGFIIVSANATQMNSDFFALGSVYSQCTITTFADKTKPPVASDNCALGQPNACCNADGGASCYKKK